MVYSKVKSKIKNLIKSFLVRIGHSSRPDFLIIGAQKAGTTGLFDILNQHSKLQGSLKKEIHYFDNDAWCKNKKYHQYHYYFPLPFKIAINTKLFEATPIYLFQPKVAQRLQSYNSNLKLIILLRNPVERAFSAWTMAHHHFKEGAYKKFQDRRSFTEAINNELDNFDQLSFYDDRKAYVKRGIYHNQIERYLKYFAVEQILFIESNEIKNQFEKTMNTIQSFLDIPFEELNLKISNTKRIDEKGKYLDVLLKLTDFYKPYNEKLFKLIGRKYNW